MERSLAETFVRILRGDSFNDGRARLSEKYSGRGMLGKETIGVVTYVSKMQVRDRLDAVLEDRYDEHDAIELNTQSQGVQQSATPALTEYNKEIEILRYMLIQRWDSFGYGWIMY